MNIAEISPRQRVNTALRHKTPDRIPVDFLATPEIWRQLASRLGSDAALPDASAFFDPAWEAVLQHLQVDCRVVSYDQFCQPPGAALHPGAVVDWFGSASRSTPNRMWRQQTPQGDLYDIWGHHLRLAEHAAGAYETFASYPLAGARSIEDLKTHPWPEPDWWDFAPLPQVLASLDEQGGYHLRFRIGSVFETAWQLRGMEAFFMDLATDPSIPLYIMDRITDVLVENTRQVLNLAAERIDMLYFYDDVATQQSLMISKSMWQRFIRPRHSRIIDVAKSFKKPVMYHCDGAIYFLIPELIEMGVDVLNPIQTDAKGMQALRLKEEFGDRLCFHGGIDIIELLPKGSVEDVRSAVRESVRVLGAQGGYILSSSHHIQPDTPLENITAMYDLELRSQGRA